MIEALVERDAVVFTGLPSAGCVAYVDADWLPGRGADAVASLDVSADGPRSDRAAANGIVAAAVRAAAPLGTTRSDSIEVVGTGAVAAVLRALLGVPETMPERPAAIVDATAEGELLEGALARVADLGTLVLAGATRSQEMSLDLYPDAHVRGITIVGVPPPHERPSEDPSGEHEHLVEMLLAALVQAQPQEQVTRDALWYRLGVRD